MNVKKDAQRLLAKAQKNGYVVVGGKSGHYKVRHPHTGHMLAYVSATPADGLPLDPDRAGPTCGELPRAARGSVTTTEKGSTMDEQLNKIRRAAKSAIRLRGTARRARSGGHGLPQAADEGRRITGIEHTKEGRMQISSNENRGVACK